MKMNYQQIGAEIVRALDLPERCQKVELTFEAGKAPIVKAEYLVHGASGEGLVKVLSGYSLVPRYDAPREPSAEPRSYRAGGVVSESTHTSVPLDVFVRFAQKQAGDDIAADSTVSSVMRRALGDAPRRA